MTLKQVGERIGYYHVSHLPSLQVKHIVKGPSLTKWTCIHEPKTPDSTAQAAGSDWRQRLTKLAKRGPACAAFIARWKLGRPDLNCALRVNCETRRRSAGAVARLSWFCFGGSSVDGNRRSLSKWLHMACMSAAVSFFSKPTSATSPARMVLVAMGCSGSEEVTDAWHTF